MKKDIFDNNLNKTFSQDAQLFYAVFENSIKDIAILDAQGTFLYANESYLKRTGYTKDELIGKNASILKSGHHNKEFYDNLWKTLNHNKNFNAVFTNKNKNGTLYHEEQIIIPIGEPDESQIFLVIGVDNCTSIADELNLLSLQNI